MAINQRTNMIRTTTYLPPAYKAWLEKESTETGLTMSNLIAMAVKQYIDQQDYIRLFPEINQRLKELNVLQDNNRNSDPVLTVLQEIEKELGTPDQKKEEKK
jgi:predicted DNA-binding protein